MTTSRRQHSASFKAKVALEALKEQKTIAQLSSEFKIHATQITNYRNQLRDNMQVVFSNDQSKVLKEKDELIDKLYHQVGKLNTEYEWLKKKLGIDD